ncbi:ChrR Cupin-like domain protein [Phycisphaerae bacterium RAS1]|nr:ChrR Cupin-like domain protein [Phycisphaerae bacterium RAS1]
MTALHSIGDSAELAALYAAGAMPAEQAAAFEAHLATGCSACESELRSYDGVVEQLSLAVAPVPPDAEVRAAVLERIQGPRAAGHSAHADAQVWKQWSADPTEGMFIRRANEGEWTETGVAGVRVRRLFADPAKDQITMLVRMDPGAAYPAHRHAGPEECLVLEGDLQIGDIAVLSAGDYQRAGQGSRHVVQSTQSGCLLLIVSSLSDELEPLAG